MCKQYISDIITIENIEGWSDGDIITINAPTGSGKSYFIKNILKKYCRESGRNILLLTNRDILKEQFLKDIEEDNEDKIITIKNYQSIEASILHKVPLEEYDFIVCDEYHYLFNDTSFNFCSDLSLDYVLSQTFNIKILLSATSIVPIRYFEEEKQIELIKYDIESDYSHIEKIYYYTDDNVILKLLNELPKNEKALYFTKAKTSYDFSKQVEDSAFICSENNYNYSEHINQDEKQNIINNEKFSSKILFTTTALDNGINIKDEQLKHIIIDAFDLDTIQQCLGRKRITNSDQKVMVYIKNWGNKKLNGKKSSINNKLKYAELLKSGVTPEELIKDYKHKNTYGNLIYDVIENEKLNKRVNEAMYFKFKYDIEQINLYMDGEYMDYVSSRLKQDEYFDLEQEVDAMTLENKLDKLVGIKMFKDEQGKFIAFMRDELFGGITDRYGSVKLNTINGYFEDNDIPYAIESKKETSRKSDNYKKHYWILCKKVYELE